MAKQNITITQKQAISIKAYLNLISEISLVSSHKKESRGLYNLLDKKIRGVK